MRGSVRDSYKRYRAQHTACGAKMQARPDAFPGHFKACRDMNEEEKSDYGRAWVTQAGYKDTTQSGGVVQGRGGKISRNSSEDGVPVGYQSLKTSPVGQQSPTM
jgi:hypothetical protein